jgi:hypothetical protein
MSIPRDVQEFIDGYPGVDDDPTCRENFEFYSNDIRCIPDNRSIQEIHERLPVYIPRIMWSLNIFSVDGLVIMTNWNTNMDIYSGCRCTLFAKAFQLLGFSRFPIREYGMNYDSQPLQTHEIESMKADPIILERIIKSYQLMLDFYGMHLVSKETGLVDRAPPPRYFAPRYRNLVRE